MGQELAREAADRFIAALHQLEEGDEHAAETIADLFADQAALSNSIIMQERAKHERQGRADIVAFWNEYRSTFKDIHSEFTDITLGEHAAGLVWHSTGTDAQNQALDYRGISLLMFDDNGKIQRFKAYFDTEQLPRQRVQ
jgi:ketosteroid isomerase-like protein